MFVAVNAVGTLLTMLTDSFDGEVAPVAQNQVPGFEIDLQGRLAACCDTLAVDSKNPNLNAIEYGAAAFGSIPQHNCQTCYSAIPLESNILMDSLGNPFAMACEVLRRNRLK